MGWEVDNQGWQIQLSLRKCDLKSILIKTGRLTEVKQLQLQSKIATWTCPLFDVYSLDNITFQRRDTREKIYMYIHMQSADIRHSLYKKDEQQLRVLRNWIVSIFLLFFVHQVSHRSSATHTINWLTLLWAYG